MTRLWLLLVLMLAIGSVAWFFFVREEGNLLGDAVEREEDEEHIPPELRGHRGGESWRNPTDRPPVPEALPDDGSQAPADADAVYLSGRVLDAETDEPLKGAEVWLMPSGEPCPRLPEAVATLGQDPSTPPLLRRVTTKADGAFGFESKPDELPPTGAVDVFATRAGYVLGVACAQTLPGELTLRLEKGLTLSGRVVTPTGAGVESAAVRARPGPETPALPGHGTPFLLPVTDEKGGFVLDGLLPGALLLDIEHPHFMPRTAGPFDPADGEALEIVLVPAMRATFKLRTDDGRDPEHPTLVWRTTDANPRSDVLLLAAESRVAHVTPDQVTGEMTSQVVRLPCDAPSVILQLKADGYATWTSEPLRLPSEGGEETYEITLTGDLETGSARITLEDDTAEPVHFANAAVEVAVMRLTPGSRSSAYVLEQRENLRITDLPAGLYRILLRSALFAPLQTDLTIEVGQEAQAQLRTRPPAKLKVRFFADDQIMVRFRLMQGSEVIHGVPEGSFSRGTDETTGEPVLSAGSDGLLLSGLASGTYTIEVLSKDYTAPSTVVHLIEGDTVETEIHVRRR